MASKPRLNLRSNLVFTGATLAVLLLVLGALAFHLATTKVATTNHVIPASTTPKTSKAQPVAPTSAANGDQTKSQTQTVTSETSTTSNGSANIENFSVTYRGNGQLHITSQFSDVQASDDCSVQLITPGGAMRNINGQMTWSGTYYTCSFDNLTNVSQQGTWSATIMVMRGSQMLASAKSTFTVSGS